MAAKQLILLRHAKSDWYAGIKSDHDRPLNERGRRQAPLVGKWLAENGYRPEHILCSSAQRTRQTLALLIESSAWGDIPTDVSADLYHSGESTLVDQITMAFGYCNALLVVGHNPGMDMLLMRFSPATELHENGKLMTTATCAVIGFDDGDLSNPELIEFQRPTAITD